MSTRVERIDAQCADGRALFFLHACMCAMCASRSLRVLTAARHWLHPLCANARLLSAHTLQATLTHHTKRTLSTCPSALPLASTHYATTYMRPTLATHILSLSHIAPFFPRFESVPRKFVGIRDDWGLRPSPEWSHCREMRAHTLAHSLFLSHNALCPQLHLVRRATRRSTRTATCAGAAWCRPTW